MNEPTVQESEIRGTNLQAVFWQQNEEDGIGEPALIVRTWDTLVEIQQEDNSVHINIGSIPRLCKQLKAYAAHIQRRATK